MPVSETPRTAETHLAAEVRRVVRVLHSYGPLPAATLCRLVGGEQWRHWTFRRALHAAVGAGHVRALGRGFYEAA
jgi:hypothetical protein